MWNDKKNILTVFTGKKPKNFEISNYVIFYAIYVCYHSLVLYFIDYELKTPKHENRNKQDLVNYMENILHYRWQ